MKREDVIRLALEAGIIAKGLPVGGVKALEKFAALVAAHEREECVRLVYGHCESDTAVQRIAAHRIAGAIRARNV